MGWPKKLRKARQRRRATITKNRKSVIRDNFLDIVCGLRATTNTRIHNGLHAYMDHVEKSIGDLISTHTKVDKLQPILAPSKSYTERLDRILDVCVIVFEELEKVTPQTTFDQLVATILARYQITAELSNLENGFMLRLMSACVGWSSMLYVAPQATPHTAPDLVRVLSGQSRGSTQFQQRGGQSAFYSSSNRPIGALLRSSGLVPLPCGKPPGLQASGIHLVTAQLNFASLEGLGGVSVKWVDELSLHCAFDKSKNELHIFRFPSRCFTSCTAGVDNLSFQKICQAHSCQARGCVSSLPSRCQTYLHEILLSYRLLFGQDRRARRLYRNLRSRIPRPRDPILDVLCGEHQSACLEELEDSPPERDVYDGSDFPELGVKLFELQEYITSQKPRTLKDVWNDRRDPHQAFAFWAVVLVGGATIVIGLLQIVLSVLQLVYTIR